MEDLAKLMDAHAGVAAWVQALGALFALGLTIFLTRRDRKVREKADVARSRSAAIALFPVFVEVFAELSWALKQVEEGNRPEAIGSDGPGADDTIAFWHTKVMPQRLVAMHPLLHELGEAAEPSQRAFFALQRLDRHFADFVQVQKLDGPPPEAWCYSHKEWSETHALALAARNRVDGAIGAISAFLK